MSIYLLKERKLCQKSESFQSYRTQRSGGIVHLAFNCSFIEFNLTLKTFGIINSSHFEIIITRDSASEHLPALTAQLNAAPRAIEEVSVIVSGAAQSLASNETFALQHETKIKTIKKV